MPVVGSGTEDEEAPPPPAQPAASIVTTITAATTRRIPTGIGSSRALLELELLGVAGRPAGDAPVLRDLVVPPPPQRRRGEGQRHPPRPAHVANVVGTRPVE